MNKWRDEQNPIAKGCGCAVLTLVGGFQCARIMGAGMGDYIGPREGAAQDIHNKNVIILTSFIVFVLCVIAGLWLTNKPRK